MSAAALDEWYRGYGRCAKEAAIAWAVCASIHREYAKGKDPFFTTRQSDFLKAADRARSLLLEMQDAE
jgi:hypothetical protein